jgi:vancomycin permeability regulator SanA
MFLRKHKIAALSIGIAIICILLLIVVITTAANRVNAYRSYIGSTVEATEAMISNENATAVVLGGGVRNDGTPSNILRNRLDASIELYQSGVVDRVIASGYVPTDGWSEPQVMADYLIAQGIPRDAVAQDEGGYDTLASCEQTARSLGETTVILVTQHSQLDRALFLCRSLGINAYGYAAENVPQAVRQQEMRENFANIKAVIDVKVRQFSL